MTGLWSTPGKWNVLARSTFLLPLKAHHTTSSATALRHVATVPGPTSLPSGLSVCTLLPVGVIGPVKSSALASTFPAISSMKGHLPVQTLSGHGHAICVTFCSIIQDHHCHIIRWIILTASHRCRR